jgi:release factor glutamine methyltransferase
VFEGSLLDPLPAAVRGRVDVFVANLPFYAADRYAGIGSVRESTILGAGADGLDLYRQLLAAAQGYLREGAVVVMQMFGNQWESFAGELPAFGLTATSAVSTGPFALGRATAATPPAPGD